MHPHSDHSPAAPTIPTALAARIARLREVAEADRRVTGVLLYGSWTTGEADAHSDVEAYVFVADRELDAFDGREFAARLAPAGRPPLLAYTNRFGILAVVFDDLMRGELHFEPAGTGIPAVRDWRGLVRLPRPEHAVLLDRTGELLAVAKELADPVPPEPVAGAQQRADELANWTLMLGHLLARGETARAHALLGTMVAPEQLQLCRLLRGSTAHWLTPSRALETDLPAEDVRRYTATTAAAEPAAVRAAARHSWQWSRELIAEAAARWGTSYDAGLHTRLAALLAQGG